MFGNMIRLSEFRRSDFKCKNQIRLGYYLRMWNLETYLKCKYQLKEITIKRGKIMQLRKCAFSENRIWGFEILNIKTRLQLFVCITYSLHHLLYLPVASICDLFFFGILFFFFLSDFNIFWHSFLYFQNQTF